MAVEELFIDLLVILVAAKLGGELAERLGQSAVLGEIMAGVLVGPSLLGWVPNPLTGAGSEAEILEFLAEFGVVLLLFEVGLESDLKAMAKVGPAATVVALLGIGVSFALGYAASWGISQLWTEWSDRTLFHVFVGATFAATSIGITARVFSDLGRLNTAEARIVLGAAVLDDIGGLIILGVISAILAGAALSPAGIAWISAKAVGGWLLALLVGVLLVPRLFDRLAATFRVRGFAVTLGIAFMLVTAWAAKEYLGMAPIVGAFAGGLILSQAKHGHRVFEDLRPIATIFVPVFFVVLGVMIEVRSLGENALHVVAIVLALTVVAVAAKLSAGLGTLNTGASRYVVGVGMVPRGEVGLIFALIGLREGLLQNWQYTALVLVMMLTTLVAPIWLKAIVARAVPVPISAEELHRREEAARLLEPLDPK